MGLKQKKTIVFYSESKMYGGHESMSLDHIKAGIRDDVRIFILYNVANKRFEEALKNKSLLNVVTVFPLCFRYKRVPILSFLLNYKLIGSILKGINPDTVVMLQGNPDACLLGTIMSRLYKIKTYSYLPIPQKLSYTGGRFSGVRDAFVEKTILPMFDKIITISNSLKECLIERGVPARKVFVVKNSVEISDVSFERQCDLRNELCLDIDDNVILLPSRVYFKQKGHDGFIRELSGIDRSKKFKYLIAGDGPDFESLKSLVKQSGSIKDDILLLGWRNDIDELISLSDIIVLPSRFEGVPLVMLEALSQGKIVLASKRDGMMDYLPEKWLFNVDVIGDFANIVNKMELNKEIADALLMKEQFLVENNRSKLGEKFMASVLS